MTFLRAVLFAKGTGADPSSYQPNRDESQWWNRRDALVRCVTAFLLGATISSMEKGNQCELVLLFEDDWSRVHMSYMAPPMSNKEQYFLPTEQAVVALWKKASQQKQGELVQENGLSCQLYKSKIGGENVSVHFDSKRDVLDYLQATCSIEFLREKGLNSSSKVLLRKFNKEALMKIGKEWKNQHQNVKNETDSLQALRSILEDLLQPITSDIQNIVAATLHESSQHELPCWDLNTCDNDSNIQPTTAQICVFLGAVRDMTSQEVHCLQQVCEKCHIPQVAVRLGPVPEFTSKILSVVAYHHAHFKLWPALQVLLLLHPHKGQSHNDNNDSRKRLHEAITQTSATIHTCTHLHFVNIVPIASTEITTDLSSRNRALWCLVRCIVVSLWRSRLAGTHDKNNTVTNTLTLWFQDGQYLTLQQQELVTLLAEKHQAAPTEFQILQALQDQLEKRSKSNQDSTTIVNCMVTSSRSVPSVLLDLDMSSVNGLCLTDLLYQPTHKNDIHEAESGSTVWILLSMRSGNKDDIQYIRQAKELFRKACQTKSIPILQCSFRISDFQDWEASAITMIQHFCYQGLLLPSLQQELDQQQHKHKQHSLPSYKQEKKKKKKKKRS